MRVKQLKEKLRNKKYSTDCNIYAEPDTNNNSHRYQA